MVRKSLAALAGPARARKIRQKRINPMAAPTRLRLSRRGAVCAVIRIQCSDQPFDGLRSRKIIALSVIRAYHCQKLLLLFRLDAFGDDGAIHLV
ncbi:hypothetical protein D3C87_1674420 [compost metagenome]